MSPITYTSEQPQEYAKGLSACETLPALNTFLWSYKSIAADAIAAMPKTNEEFDVFRRGLKKERRGVFAGIKFAEKYNAITMPSLMFRVSMIADSFKVPWGLAFIRLEETGKIIKRKDGTYEVVEGPK